MNLGVYLLYNVINLFLCDIFTVIYIFYVFQLQMKQLPRSTIDEMLESNKFLHLPRISSQTVFDQLCPPMSSEKRKK